MKALIISFVTHLAVIGAVLLGSVVAPETMPRLLKRISPPILASIVPPHDVPLKPRPKNTTAKSSSTVTGATVVNDANDPPVFTPNGITPESGHEGSGAAGGGVVGVVDGVAGMSEIGTFAAPVPLPAPAPPRPVRLHSGMTAPRKIVDVPPNYPEMALRTRVEGTVIIEATVDERGNVIEARVVKSIALLDAAALAAVRQWKFAPARLNSEAVPVVMTVTVNFQLR